MRDCGWFSLDIKKKIQIFVQLLKKSNRCVKRSYKVNGLILGGCDCAGDSWGTSQCFVPKIMYIVLLICTTNRYTDK